nr:hypothetical protein [Tanacetum cinerariifolium]
MDITINQQVALDDALVPHTNRLRIGKSNFRLRSDLKSKESTRQVMYDVLKLTPFYKAFLVIADVPKIYIQEFWATATLHHHSISFKMNNKKHIVNLDKEIKMITDVNINKLHQPWRSFAAIINKSLSGKSTEHKDSRKSNEMYYPHFIKVIVNFFMTKDQSIPRRNKTKASVKKKQSSSDTTMPPPTTKGKRLKTLAKIDKHTKEKQPNKTSKVKCLTVLSEVALTEAEQMKLATKQSLTQTHISHVSGLGTNEGTCIIPGVLDVPTYESDDEEISWKSSEEDDDDEVNMSKHDEDVNDQSDDDDQNDDEQTDSDNDDDDFIHPKFSTHDDEYKEEESFNLIIQTPSYDEKTDDEGNDEDSHGMNVEGDEMDDE